MAKLNKSSNKPKTVSPNVSILGLSALYIFIWGIVFLRVPKNWIGLKDGYYYSIWIKTFIESPSLEDINGSEYVSYPFYWFWFWGRIYRLLGWDSPSNYYALTAMISFAGGTLLAFWILQKSLSTHLSFVMVFTFEFFFLMTNQVQIWQKPHEHFSFLITFSSLIYISSNAFKKSRTPSKELIIIGALLGLAYGSYSPPVIAVFPGLILYSMIRLKNINWRSFSILATSTLLVSLPEIYVTLKTLVTFRTAPTPLIYQITEFFPNLWIPVWLMIFAGISLFLPARDELLEKSFFFRIMLMSILIMYVVVQISYFFDVIINRSDILLLSATILLVWLPLMHIDLNLFFTKSFSFIAPVIVLILFFANTTPQFPGADTDFRSNYQISVARGGNWTLNKTAEIYEAGHCGKKVFSNDELRFLPAAIDCRTPMTLPFNEGNTGPDIPYQERILEFENAVKGESSELLNQWLNKTDTEFLALYSINGKFYFDFLINKLYPISGTVPYPTFSISEEKFTQLLDPQWRVEFLESGLFVASRSN
jgi:hypothetical protein